MKSVNYKAKGSGFALASTIVIFFILFVLSASYLASVQQDYNVARTLWAQTQAVYLARSGIQYYIDNYVSEGADANLTSPKKIFLDNAKTKSVEIQVSGDQNFLYSTGTLYTAAGKVRAKEKIITPVSDLAKWHRM